MKKEEMLKIKMSRIQEPRKAFFPCGNPFRMLLPKGSSLLSPELLALLNKFEESLAGRMEQLQPAHIDDVFSFSWMLLAMRLLSETHTDLKSLITELELPIPEWDDKWVAAYLDNSLNLLDICNGLSSELSRLYNGQLLLRIVSNKCEGMSSNELLKASKSSMDDWRQHIGGGNARIDICIPIIDKLMESLRFPKVKNSAKGKVLMRAMYGVNMVTLFVCSVWVSVFTGLDKKLVDLKVSGTPLWGKSFNDLQTCVFGQFKNLLSSGRNVLLKEVEAVDIGVKELYPMIDEAKEPDFEPFKKSFSELGKRVVQLSSGLDSLTKEVDVFFHIVFSGRNALFRNLQM